MRILLQQKMKMPPVQSTLLFAIVFLNSTTFNFPLASRLSGQLLLNSPIKCYYMVIVKLMQTSWTERNLVLLNIKHFSLSMDIIIDSSRGGSTDTCHSTFCKGRERPGSGVDAARVSSPSQERRGGLRLRPKVYGPPDDMCMCSMGFRSNHLKPRHPLLS
jgi:hypothetical protein